VEVDVSDADGKVPVPSTTSTPRDDGGASPRREQGQRAWWKGRGDVEWQVGPHVRLRARDGLVVCFVANVPVWRVAREDRVTLRVRLAALAAEGVVTLSGIGRSGLVAKATAERDMRAMRTGGAEAVRIQAEGKRRGRPPKLDDVVAAEVVARHQKGDSNIAIGARFGVSEGTVRNILRARGVGSTSSATQAELPMSTPTEPASEGDVAPEPPGEAGESSPSEAEPRTLEAPALPTSAAVESVAPATTAAPLACVPVTRPTTLADVEAQRAMEMVLARLGFIPEQSALFPPLPRVRYAGVLLGLALLSVTGLLGSVRAALGVLPNGLYNVRSIVTTLVAMALLRCKRPEQLKGFDPPQLGAVLGLARAPEMKTVRRKMRAISSDEARVEKLVAMMAKHHAARAPETLGYLYVDGHVRAYFGDEPLPKTHHTAMRISLPATTDYWLSDDRGAPLLVLTTEGNAAMTRAMPDVLREARAVVGPTAQPTVVFDRGGYCIAMFQLVRDSGMHFLTYRKGKAPPVPTMKFRKVTVRRGDKKVVMRVADGYVRLRKFGRVRRVAVLRPDGKQTHVLTSREDATPVEILERMFGRWQQENLFKYLGEEFAFDALWTYRKVAADAARRVPNPIRKKLDRRLRELREKRAELTASIGTLVRTSHPLDAARFREEKRAQVAVAEQVASLGARIKKLVARRKKVPVKVAVGAVIHRPRKLAPGPKLFGDVIKMAAFHIETMLVAALAPSLKRAGDEARAVVADFMQLDGSFERDGNVLVITLAAPAAPRYVRALEVLCDHVNALDAVFPETDVRLTFRVATGPADPPP
jgi:hypothetical protein